MGKAMTPPIATRDADLLRNILTHLRVVRGPDARGEYVCWCPFHPDGQGNPPHQPNLRVSERGYVCHACGAAGSLRRLAEHLHVTIELGRNEPEATYNYCDKDGGLLYQVLRFPAKRFRLRRPIGAGKWVWNLNGVKRVLYRLPEVLTDPTAIVYVTEGEKDTDRLTTESLVATTNSGGAGKWRKEYSELLRGRDVVILPDNDEPGRRHGQHVARSLQGLARSIKVVNLPKLPEKGDVSDWLDSGHTTVELAALAEDTSVWIPPAAPDGVGPSRSSDPGKLGSQADRLVALTLGEGVELFHDQQGDGFACVPVGQHREIRRCRSKDFRRWLEWRFWQNESKAPSPDALNAACNAIEARAHFADEEHRLCNRVASRDGEIWYDLADPDWRAVKVASQGWEIATHPPILFRRYGHQRPQVEPVHDGDLHDLLGFVNLRDSSSGLLLLVYLVSCFLPDIPHPILVLHGPQGSAKTTLFKMLGRLVDPSLADVLSFPRDGVELVQQLSHHWAPFYDNISSLPDSVSDILCRTVTGEGFSKRELYSDDEDVIYQFRRCIGLNGVNVVARKPDLLDRSILLGLEPIAATERRSEEEFWKGFEEVQPQLVGAIFDVLAGAIALRDSIQLLAKPRMADFALWGCAIARALGNSERDFLAAFDNNCDARNEEALQASPIAIMVVELMETRHQWEGTASDLLAELKALADDHRVDAQGRGWPRAPQSLSRQLNEVRPNLAAVGIAVATRRDCRHRLVTIRKNPVNSVTSVTSDAGGVEIGDLTAPQDDASEGCLDVPSPAASLGEMLEQAPDAAPDASDSNDAPPGYCTESLGDEGLEGEDYKRYVD